MTNTYGLCFTPKPRGGNDGGRVPPPRAPRRAFNNGAQFFFAEAPLVANLFDELDLAATYASISVARTPRRVVTNNNMGDTPSGRRSLGAAFDAAAQE